MSLTQCHECKAQVSDQAAACPSCGAPTIARSAREAIAIKRNGFFAARWISGVLFWPGVALVVWPMVVQQPELFANNWMIARWLLAAGALHYIASEIDRNVFERKVKRAQ